MSDRPTFPNSPIETEGPPYQDSALETHLSEELEADRTDREEMERTAAEYNKILEETSQRVKASIDSFNERDRILFGQKKSGLLIVVDAPTGLTYIGDRLQKKGRSTQLFNYIVRSSQDLYRSGENTTEIQNAYKDNVSKIPGPMTLPVKSNRQGYLIHEIPTSR